MAPHAMRRPAAQQQVLPPPGGPAAGPSPSGGAAAGPAPPGGPAASPLSPGGPAVGPAPPGGPAASPSPPGGPAAAPPCRRGRPSVSPAVDGQAASALRQRRHGLACHRGGGVVGVERAGRRRAAAPHPLDTRAHPRRHAPSAWTREEFPTGASGVPSSIGWPRAQTRILRPPPPTPDIS